MAIKQSIRHPHDSEAAATLHGRHVGWLVVLAALLGAHAAEAAPPAHCDLRLTIELTPDVPDPGDAGFLSSLLGDHPGYRLAILRKPDASVIDVDLTGPGPEYLCRDVIEAIRKDGRVRSVHVQSGPSG